MSTVRRVFSSAAGAPRGLQESVGVAGSEPGSSCWLGGTSRGLSLSVLTDCPVESADVITRKVCDPVMGVLLPFQR